MNLWAFAFAHLVSAAFLLVLHPRPAVAEPQGFGRALILRICGEIPVSSFCTCHERLHNVPVNLNKEDYSTRVCKSVGENVPDSPAKLSPPNFPSMEERETIQFLFVTLYGNEIKTRSFCPYKECDAINNEWRIETWSVGERFRSIASVSVIAAVYGRSECLKAQPEPANAKWVADLKGLLPAKDHADLEKELRTLATTRLPFGGVDQSMIEAGCGIDPWHIYGQMKPKP
jgi:hypothetical protein